MPRNLLFSLLTAASIMMVTAASANDLAVMDFRRVIGESAEMKRASTEVDTMKQAMEKQLATLEKEIESESETLERKRSMMTEEQVIEEETALKGKIREFRLKRQNLSEQLSNEVMLRRKQIITVMQGIVSKLAQEKGYKLVVEQGNLLYADPSVDITDEVLKRVNAHYENN
tara:strand:- start:569534 stop:570049 length:516 start_codon:yes stop_codon:yes gene_type:complete